MPSSQRYPGERSPRRYRLEAGKCAGCGKIYFPPRLVCAECRSREFETITLAARGTVVTFTIIAVGASDFADQVP